jgi:hypothetical protein
MKHDDAKADMKMDKAQDKKMMVKAVHKHEKKLHPGQPLTKLAKGGKTNLQMKQLGRGLAKVANQKKSSFTYKKGG